MLSEKGFNQARQVGDAIRWLNIPVGQVMASQYGRDYKTAALSFGHYVKIADLNFAESDDQGEYTDAMNKKMKGNLVALLSTKPMAATNTALVGHDDPFEMAIGIYPEPLGVVYVIQPEGDGYFKIIGRIAPDEWQTLGAAPNTHNER